MNVIQVCERHVHRYGQEPGCVDLPAPARTLMPGDLADAILGLAGPGRCVLVLPSSWCYVQRFELPRRRPTRTMLECAFEEYLPSEIETLTCDFARVGPSAWLGIALETTRLQPLLGELAVRGVHVERITLDVLAQPQPDGTLLWCGEEYVALLTCSGGIRDLRVLRLAAGEGWVERVAERLLEQGASVAEKSEPPPGMEAPPVDGGCSRSDMSVFVSGCANPELRSTLAARIGAVCVDPELSAAAIDINLARGPLASQGVSEWPRLWERSAVIALVAAVLLIAALLTHRARLAARLQEIAAWEVRAYREVFDDAPPAGVALRVASERRRLEAQSPARASAPDALRLLRDVVAALPPVRLDLQELRIEAGGVTLRGRTRDHADAEKLSQALDRLAGLDCSSPRTDRAKDGGVQFLVVAQVSAPERRP